ncbi:hypothetical protein J7X09_004475 [Vibrio parahaemolyticus]|nr:hypothetical protein [Vibrio parahaemolyticus]
MVSIVEFCSEHNYLGRSQERSYISEISDLFVGRRSNELELEYCTPQQNNHGTIKIWRGLEIDLTTEPIWEASLEKYKGKFTVVADAINFNSGAYVIAISVDESNRAIAATNTLLNGQVVLRGSSYIAVTAKQLNRVVTIFTIPPNVGAVHQETWATIYKGDKPNMGEKLAQGYAPLNESSGVIKVEFDKGSLKTGDTYNVCLSVGDQIKTISAAYVFQYLLP